MPSYNTINIHPNDHLPSSLKTKTFDVICIGSGWAGRVAAARVVKAGLTAVIVENELVGGDCPFWACVPSKALLRPEVAFDNAKAVSGVKERVDASKGLDVQSVFARRDMYTGGWDDSKVLIPLVESSGTVIVRGTGTVVGEKKVAVESHNGEKAELEARHAVIVSTGSEAAIPKIPGLAETDPWGPRQATSSDTVPEHLIILGAGAVGCEMATIFASLGSKISIVCSSDEILTKFDPEAGELVRKNMEKFGLTVYNSVKATSVSKDSAGKIKVSLSNGTSITGTQILLATGRTPKTTGVGLERFSIPTDGTPVDVDESLCIKSVPGNWLYAAGDINGRAPLTHFCKYEGTSRL
jgi:pyruvate/2-oxoglutarate dehydrogenase complex dihydrolipoamide dehydrogenase (E3) component